MNSEVALLSPVIRTCLRTTITRRRFARSVLVGPVLAILFSVTLPTRLCSGQVDSAQSQFRIDRSTPNDCLIALAGKPVFELRDGMFIRFRCNPNDDHWIGTQRDFVNLGWSRDAFVEVDQLTCKVNLTDNGFELTVTGRKPAFDDAPFTTSVRATLIGEPDTRLRYTFCGALTLPDVAAYQAKAGRALLEFIDIWYEGIFWPQRDNHDRALYQHFLFGSDENALVRAPKLHIFPSLPAAEYCTLIHNYGHSGIFALVDEHEDGMMLRLKSTSHATRLGICWWTWDAHFLLLTTPENPHLTFEFDLESFDAAVGKRLLLQSKPLDFSSRPDSHLPVFERDTVNTFARMIATEDDWAWEPNSRACAVDETIGDGDSSSVTIRHEKEQSSAWCARTLGNDYGDHRPLASSYTVTARVRCRDLDGMARIGVMLHHGGEAKWSQEGEHVIYWSQPLDRTRDWTELRVTAATNGYNRIKIVLSHDGTGQSWFDNVTVTPTTTTPGRLAAGASTYGAAAALPLDWSGWQTNDESRALPLSVMSVSRAGMFDGPRIAMAWKDCAFRTPFMSLAPGRYRMIVQASADGCEDDPPRIAFAISGMPAQERAISPVKPCQYGFEFTLPHARDVVAEFTFLNDGPCGGSESPVDKNVFVNSIELWRVSPVQATSRRDDSADAIADSAGSESPRTTAP